MKIVTLAFSSILLVALTVGCGETTKDRAISGGLIGAGAGAVGAAATGGSVGGGALIGAGVGAASGAATDENDVDLGKPIWKR